MLAKDMRGEAHNKKFRRTQIGLVEEHGPVCQDRIGDYEEIDLCQESALFRGIFLGKPPPKLPPWLFLRF